MDIQQHIPIKIGFPPVLISFIILVFKPIAAIAIIIKNFDNCLKKANIEMSTPAETVTVVIIDAKTKNNIKVGNVFFI